jgi:hypothetical protein
LAPFVHSTRATEEGVERMRAAKSFSVLFLGCLLSITAVAGCAEEEDTTASDSYAAGAKPDLDPPVLTIVGSTQTTITVRVCAGDSGAPAGFSLHWTTAADYAANGWSSLEVCSGSFSGVPIESTYSLGPNECIDVVVGALDDSEIGVSFADGCNGGLLCGTEYAFRSFAHANRDFNRSDFSAVIFAHTESCDDGCTLTQGYWKNHSEAWPVDTLSLGSVSYSQAELLSILGERVGGNGLVSLAHQLIAAKLNVASGANASAISSTIAAADALIGGLVVPPVGLGFLAPSSTDALTSALDDWNNGITGPGHCE